VLRLARLSRRPANQQRLRELAFVYADITDVPIAALRWDQVVIDRTNRSWQELFAMARLFLQDRYQTTTGGAGQGTAMLFEMNALFEEYVGRLIARALAGTGFTVSLQGGRLFCLSAQDSGRALFQTRPDILIRQGGRVVHVIDTKWKRISARIDDPKQGVSQADVYQMMAYAQLYDAPRLTLLYPHHPGLGSEDAVHGRYSITGHATILETASIDVANSTDMLSRLRSLLIGEASAGPTGDEMCNHNAFS
jgi:5-methylcytosine-specific restriction enzyme subunit McrC